MKGLIMDYELGVAAILRRNGSRDRVRSASLHGPKKILAVDAEFQYLAELTGCLREDGYEVGLEFLGVHPHDERRLREYLAQRR